VQCLGCRVQGAGLRVPGAGLRVKEALDPDPCTPNRAARRVHILSLADGRGSGLRVQGAGFRVEGAGCRIEG
jgi:hypothetical protein